MWLLVMMAGLTDAPPISRRWLRLALIAGPAVFLVVGLGGLGWARRSSPIRSAYAKPLILAIEVAMTLTVAADARPADGGCAGTERRAMSAATVFGLCGAVAVGLGLYGLIVNPQPLRKILAFNLIGSGVFLLFGVVARRGAAAGVRRRSGAAGAGHHGHRRRLFRDGAGGRAAAAAVRGDRLGHACADAPPVRPRDPGDA